ncbi:hypothetical protein Tco_1387546, partial [Tanacetum coccineum]
KERPQADARIDAEVEEMLDGTPRKKSRTARDDVKMEGNKNKRRNSRNFCGGTTQREETRLNEDGVKSSEIFRTRAAMYSGSGQSPTSEGSSVVEGREE